MIEKTREFRLLSLLETDPTLMPKHGHNGPFWRPKPPQAAAAAHLPAWDWAYDLEPPHGTPMVDIDVNAGYLSAASSATVGLGPLEHTKARPYGTPASPAPGYYLVDVQYWGHPEMPSPLGDTAGADQVWISAPTMQQLHQLSLRDDWAHWDTPTVHDSWTAKQGVRLRKWATYVNLMRCEIMDTQGKGAAYDQFKTAYSQAIAMMLTGAKCKTHRPDWAHTIYAQHAATYWRKALRSADMHHGPVRLGDTDEIAYTAADYAALRAAGDANPKLLPWRMDPTGHTLGSMKIKRQYAQGDPDPTANA